MRGTIHFGMWRFLGGEGTDDEGLAHECGARPFFRGTDEILSGDIN